MRRRKRRRQQRPTLYESLTYTNPDNPFLFYPLLFYLAVRLSAGKLVWGWQFPDELFISSRDTPYTRNIGHSQRADDQALSGQYCVSCVFLMNA